MSCPTLLGTIVHKIDKLLKIECADGSQLPYFGYVKVDVDVLSGLPVSEPKSCLPLVIPDTPYSEKTPIILGTNVLKEFMTDCKSKFGDNFLQRAGLFTPWYLCFRTIVVRDRELRKNNNRIAVIRCAETSKVILKPNQTISVKGNTDKEMNFTSTTAIIQGSEDSAIPHYVDVTEAVIHFESGQRKEVNVTLSNLTIHTVVITPKAVICELQHVSVTDEVFENISDLTEVSDFIR